MLFKLVLAVTAISFSVLASAEGKIAVLNPQAAIFNTELAQARLKALQEEAGYVENRKELDALEKSLREQAERLQKDAAVMSLEQRQAEAQKVQEKRADMEHVQKKLRAAEQQALQSVAQDLEPKFQKAVSEVVEAEGIGLLLNRQAAMLVHNSYSITAKVTDKLNQMK